MAFAPIHMTAVEVLPPEAARAHIPTTHSRPVPYSGIPAARPAAAVFSLNRPSRQTSPATRDDLSGPPPACSLFFITRQRGLLR